MPDLWKNLNVFEKLKYRDEYFEDFCKYKTEKKKFIETHGFFPAFMNKNEVTEQKK